MLAADDKQEQDENDQQGGQEAAADKMEVDQEEMEEDEDDLEAMMRSYMEKVNSQTLWNSRNNIRHRLYLENCRQFRLLTWHLFIVVQFVYPVVGNGNG